MTISRVTIAKFWRLAGERKSAALDVNTKSGEMTVRRSVSSEGIEGEGVVPATYSDDWARIVTSVQGMIIWGADR